MEIVYIIIAITDKCLLCCFCFQLRTLVNCVCVCAIDNNIYINRYKSHALINLFDIYILKMDQKYVNVLHK